MKSRIRTIIAIALATIGFAACGGSSKAAVTTTGAPTTSTLPAGKCSVVPLNVVNEIVAGVKPQFSGYASRALVVPVPPTERLRVDWPQHVVDITYQERAIGAVHMTFAINTLDDPLPIVPISETARFATMWGFQHGEKSPEGKWASGALFQSPAYSALTVCA